MKLVQVVGFITTEFVTMHGHTNVKKSNDRLHLRYHMETDYGVCTIDNNKISLVIKEPIPCQAPGVNTYIPTATVLHITSPPPLLRLHPQPIRTRSPGPFRIKINLET